MGTKQKGTVSVDQQLEAAKMKIAELEKALEDCRQECAFEREDNGGFLLAFLDSKFKAQATANDLIVSQAEVPADTFVVANAVANAWRRASEMLQEFAVSERPQAQEILAAIDGTDKRPLRSHLLLIAALVELVAEARGRSTNLRGLQAEINSDIREKHKNVLGLGETKIQQMLADANKAGGNNGFNVFQ